MYEYIYSKDNSEDNDNIDNTPMVIFTYYTHVCK